MSLTKEKWKNEVCKSFIKKMRKQTGYFKHQEVASSVSCLFEKRKNNYHDHDAK